ncbi:MAG: fused MFS/spermidine synthase [Deltaproteobacteria bacterium]|nr:fused MFS/spermidine synthase [Deltaproteobacteria bacterium]
MRLLRAAALYLSLFLSGAAALIYEASWGRMLQRVFGVSDLAVATVLAAFFLGLGLGNALGARIAARFRRSLRAYAAAEAGIGLYALASLALLPRVHVLYGLAGPEASFGALSALRLGLSLVVLLPPTVLMGATLPLLVAARPGESDAWSEGATGYYACNTAGAVVGAGASGLWLVPHLGVRLTVILAAAASLTGAALVLSLVRAKGALGAAEATDAALPASGFPRRAALLAFLAGVASLAGEVVWTRALRIIVGGTTQAFSAMLVVYLSGIALGSVLGERWTRGRGRPLVHFGLSQVLAACWTMAALGLAPQLPRALGLLHRAPELDAHAPGVVLGLSVVLLLPLALCVGAALPLAWRCAGGSAEEASRRAGAVLSANTLGGLLGSLGAGFALVPLLGLERAVVALSCAHLATAAVAFLAGLEGPRRALGVALPVALGALFVGAHPSLHLPFLLGGRNDPLKAIVEGPGPHWSRDLLFLEEGRNTTVTVLREGAFLRLYNDGRPEAAFRAGRHGAGPEQALLSSLPNLLAERRERALVVGLGAGHSTNVLLAGPWRRVDVVELEASVVNAARFLHRRQGTPFPLDSPRARLLVDDARARLVLAPSGAYDAVVSQPSHPWLAGSSALYTREFFREVRRALRPGGVFALWVNLFHNDIAHTRAIVATLREVFPTVQGFTIGDNSLVLSASVGPQALDARVEARLFGDSGALGFLAPYGVRSLADLASLREFEAASSAAFAGEAEPIVDDRPTLEFDLAKLPGTAQVTHRMLDARLGGGPWMTPEAFLALPVGVRVPTVLRRIERVQARRAALEAVARALPALAMAVDDQGLVQGALAQALGDPRGALTTYEGSGSPEAALRADRLRLDSEDYEGLLAVASRRAQAPASSLPVRLAAAAVGTPTALGVALAVAGRVPEDERPEVTRALEAMARGGCPALLALGEALRGPGAFAEFAFMVERCAVGAGAPSRGWASLAERARRAEALARTTSGQACVTGGNDRAALGHFRRALALNPGNGPAAAGAARLLAAHGRRDEAERLLRDALGASQGLPQSSAVIVSTARELGLSLRDPEADSAGDTSGS